MAFDVTVALHISGCEMTITCGRMPLGVRALSYGRSAFDGDNVDLRSVVPTRQLAHGLGGPGKGQMPWLVRPLAN